MPTFSNIATPEGNSAGRARLDGPPPLPARTATRSRTMLDAGTPEQAGPQNPVDQAKQQIEDGFRKLVELLPGTVQVAVASVTAMRRQVEEQVSGAGQPAGPPAPGGMGMGPPPPMMPPGGLGQA